MNDLENNIDKIYNEFINLNNIINKNLSFEKLEEISILIENYDLSINKIKNTIKQIDNIKSQFKFIYLNKIKNIKHSKDEHLVVNKNDTITNEFQIENVNLTHKEENKNKKYYNTPVIIISEKSINNIINTPIYLIKETNEFCIKINNKLIKGNIGNIVDKKNKKKIKKCNRLYCNNTFFNKIECKYYHDNNKEIRNFPDYSWKPVLKNKLGKVKHKNKNVIIDKYDIENTRFIGSLDSLNYDLTLTSEYEKKLRNKQLMHDILLYQILDNYLE